MKRMLRWLGFMLAVLLGLGSVGAAYIALAPLPRHPVPGVEFQVDVTPERVARGKRAAETLCVTCHLDSETGALTRKRMLDLPPQFGESWSRNITGHPVEGIGSWTDGEIAYLLRTGVARDGRYTPPWMIKLPNAADEDLRDIIAFLRSDDPLVQARDVGDQESRPSFLTKVLSRVAFGPFPYPSRPVEAPPPANRVEHGRYLATALYQCHGCHSADFRTVDDLRPERSKGFFGGGNAMTDLSGQIVPTANLTPDAETGIGRWTEEQFRRAVVEGIRPDNRPLRYPMLPFRSIPDEQVSAIFTYLRSIPAIRNSVPSPTPPARASLDGKQIYYAYGCNGCHGDSGRGQWDLRRGTARYPTDAELIAYIKHPEKTRPGVAMPTWEGVIREEEYAPLAAYLRSLAASNSGDIALGSR
jgi:mono/diheme cytochrome c family protein